MNDTAAATGKQKGIGKAALIDVAKHDEIKQLGFRAEKLESGWSAYEISGDRVIGPADSINALLTKVKLEIGDKFELPANGNVELTETSTGQQFIPGTGPIVNKELTDAARAHFDTKNTRMEWSEKEKEAKDTLIAVAHKYEDLFQTDEATGKRTYMAGDIEVELVVEEKENIKTRWAANESEDLL